MATQGSDLTVTYAGLALGGSSSTYLLSGRYELSQDYPTGTFGAEVLVVAATKAALLTACAALEVAWRKPRQDFTLVNGAGNTFVTWSHASNTGMNAAPSATKSRSEANSALSKAYDLTLSVELPADLSGVSGRQSGRIRVDHDASRIRTVTVDATYTALSGNSATAQVTAAMATFAASVQSDLSIAAWELISQTVDYGDQNKSAQVSHTYREIRVNQVLGALDDAQLRDPTLEVRRTRIAPGDFQPAGATVRRLVDVTVEYRASVDATLTTAIAQVWTSKVRPLVIQHALSALGGSGAAALVSEGPMHAVYGNRVGVTQQWRVLELGGFIAYSMREITEGVGAEGLIRVWAGGPLDAERLPRAGELRQTREVTRTRALSGQQSTIMGIPAGQAGVTWGGGFTSIGGIEGSKGSTGSGQQIQGVVDRFRREVSPSEIGLDGYRIAIIEETVVTVSEYYTRPAAVAVVQGSPATPGAPGVIPGLVYAQTVTIPASISP